MRVSYFGVYGVLSLSILLGVSNASGGGEDDGKPAYAKADVCDTEEWSSFKAIVDAQLATSCFPNGDDLATLASRFTSFKCPCNDGPEADIDRCAKSNSSRLLTTDPNCTKAAKEKTEDLIEEYYKGDGACSDACDKLMDTLYANRCYWRLYYESEDYSFFGVQKILDAIDSSCRKVKWGMVILLCATSLFATMIALAGFGKLSMMIRSRSDATSAAKKT